MSRSNLSIAVVALLAIGLNCDRQPAAFESDTLRLPTSSFAIVDAANGGTAGFYFLPPTVPTKPAYTGTFDATLQSLLRVEVCKLNGSVCVQPPVSVLTSVAADPRNAIRVNTVRQFYNVYWYVAPAVSPAGKTFRATVFGNGTLLGYIDFANPRVGAWLPITFRVEQGAIQPNTAPVISITSPSNGVQVPEGSGINFSGTATDAQDGDVSGSLTWTSSLQGAIGTGASLSNVMLTPGAHTITASATDSKGLVGTASITVNVVANAAPVVSITAPANNTSVLHGNSVTFTATATDAEDGSISSSISWSSNIGGVIGTGASVSTSALSVGTHTITASVSDSRGAAGSASITVIVTGNNAPTVTITSPITTSFVQGRPITFTATATDPEDGDITARISWSSNRDGPLGTGASIIRSNLSVNTHTITASVTDAAGNTTVSQIIVNVSANQLPTVTITAPANNSDLKAGSSVTFTGTASDPEDGDVTATITWTSSVAGSIGTGGSFSLSNLAVGTHLITAAVTDADGATSTSSVTITITNSAPVVTITSPSNGASIPAGSITFTATASDPESGNLDAAIQWFVDGGQVGTGPSYITSYLSTGSHSIEARVTDGYGGNASATISITVTFNTGPTVTINTPANGAIIQAGTPVSFTGTASDAQDGDVTPSLQWVSNRQGTIGSGGSFSVALSGGTHTITATATDPAGATGSASIAITISIISAPATLNVPYGGTASLPIALAEPAPPGGLTLNVTSSDPTRVSVTTPTVSIPAGALAANATLAGAAPGPSIVTISHPTYGAGHSTVTTTANLNIVEASLSINSSQTGSLTIQLESQGSPLAAPAGGMGVTLTSSNTACVADPVDKTIAAGLVSTTSNVSYGGTATLPCSATISATSSMTGVTSDAVTVSVTSAVTITFAFPSARIGSGLVEQGYFAQLGTASHGGVTVRLASANPSLLKVGPNNTTTVGTDYIDVFVPDGQTTFFYSLHGMEGQTGTTSLTASAPGFTTATVSNQVVSPIAFDVQSAPATTTTLAPNTPFFVRVGSSQAGNPDALQTEQSIRPGGTPFTVNVSNSDAVVGQLQIMGGAAGQTAALSINPGQSRTPYMVAGGIEFDPISSGTTTISVNVPGVNPAAGLTKLVTVTAPGITFAFATARVGSGLSEGGYRVQLGAANHGGVTVRLASVNPSLLKVGPDNTSTIGTDYIDVTLPNGQTTVFYSLHGMEGQTGTTSLTASAPGFNTATVSNQVVSPVAFDVQSAPATTTTLAANTPFYVRIGASQAGNPDAVQTEQPIRPGGTPVTVNVSNSDAAVGQLQIIGGAAIQTAMLSINPGQSRTPHMLAGGLEFDPISSGTTTISVNVPGVNPTAGVTKLVTVTAPSISFIFTTARIGSGLAEAGYRLQLGAANHGGVTVRLASGNPALLKVGPDNTSTIGTDYIDVTLPNGQTTVFYSLHGMEGQTGTTSLTASAPGFATATVSNQVVSPVAFDVSSLPTTTTTLSPNTSFFVRIGSSQAANPDALQTEQPIRPGGTPLTVNVSNSHAGVAQLQILGGSASQNATLSINPGQSRTPNGPAGTLQFDPLAIGTSTVTATVPGANPAAGISSPITVNAPTIAFGRTTTRVGSGLMESGYTLVLGATAHGGVTVRIASSAGTVLKVGPNDMTTTGTDFIDVFVPDGQSTISYSIHGMESQSGTVTLTASAPGFTNGTASVTVAVPVLELQLVPATVSAAAANVAFYARIGVSQATDPNALLTVQAVRAGASPLAITISNSNSAVAQLQMIGGAAGQSHLVFISPGSKTTPYSVAGGVQFDPLAAGSTTVTASAPGFNPVAGYTRNVTVN